MNAEGARSEVDFNHPPLTPIPQRPQVDQNPYPNRGTSPIKIGIDKKGVLEAKSFFNFRENPHVFEIPLDGAEALERGENTRRSWT